MWKWWWWWWWWWRYRVNATFSPFPSLSLYYHLHCTCPMYGVYLHCETASPFNRIQLHQITLIVSSIFFFLCFIVPFNVHHYLCPSPPNAHRHTDTHCSLYWLWINSLPLSQRESETIDACFRLSVKHGFTILFTLHMYMESVLAVIVNGEHRRAHLIVRVRRAVASQLSSDHSLFSVRLFVWHSQCILLVSRLIWVTGRASRKWTNVVELDTWNGTKWYQLKVLSPPPARVIASVTIRSVICNTHITCWGWKDSCTTIYSFTHDACCSPVKGITVCHETILSPLMEGPLLPSHCLVEGEARAICLRLLSTHWTQKALFRRERKREREGHTRCNWIRRERYSLSLSTHSDLLYTQMVSYTHRVWNTRNKITLAKFKSGVRWDNAI